MDFTEFDVLHEAVAGIDDAQIQRMLENLIVCGTTIAPRLEDIRVRNPITFAECSITIPAVNLAQLLGLVSYLTIKHIPEADYDRAINNLNRKALEAAQQTGCIQ